MIHRYGDPLAKPPKIEAGDTEKDKENKGLLKRIAIWKLMRADDTIHLGMFVEDNIHGRKLRLKKGSLGLSKVEA
jgi:hypothetical protein